MGRLAAILAVLCYLAHGGSAQDMARVRHHIDTLCSEAMLGRGYVAQGEHKAAVFLAKRFQEIGLKPLGDGYFQHFQFQVNTFPDRVALQIGKKVLTPGVDFLADPSCGPGVGKGKIYWLDTLVFTDETAQSRFLKASVDGQIIGFDAKYDRKLQELPPLLIKKMLKAPALLSLHEQLTFAVGKEQLRLPKFNVLKSSLPKRCKKMRFEVAATLNPSHTSQNVLGYVEGTEQPDRFLFVTAHYDHLGAMGKQTYFPGANDNASGVAMMLELANYFAENPLPYSIAFIGFGAEEAGLLGSLHYVQNPVVPLTDIEFVVNLDLFATGEEGMTVVNGLVFQQEYEALLAINEREGYLSQIKARGRAANSDHYFFSESGVPAFFFYLMGDWPHYHDVYDDAPVPLSAFPKAFGLVRDFIHSLSER